MNIRKLSNLFSVAILVAATASTGCQNWRAAKQYYQPPEPVRPLGAFNDHIFEMHEENAEASEFVVYDHEFNLNTAVLNTAGRDHVTQIAARIQAGQKFPVVVERSMTTSRETTEFEYPVHPNPGLDMHRREMLVYALQTMGVPDAGDRVVVAPAFAEGLDAAEAAGAYQSGFRSFNGNSGAGGNFGFGGFSFGGGGFGGGGFGGGIF